ncbi:twin-arginine translocase TatA/TatE family subunit [Rubrobacter tropicus]|uniref:Sec-independent protein translocase protein TatA n=1 Tax=Rubrobacter tropicus TaxID=2653851 RepID=A0A6G8QA74_9ACTN|nr:twin-arginine translocase TatA/TatE family subunit [Rubrobacter tropicus]QIN83376.1 twin-arginine translocase TatA/TatE family subunit [Rubrobacter tropicus]
MSFALIPGLPTLGPTELIIALVVILLLFGAKRIPELARGLGSGVREFKAGTKEGQLEDKDKKDKEKKDEEGPVAEDKTDEAKVEDDATVRAEKAEQKRS